MLPDRLDAGFSALGAFVQPMCLTLQPAATLKVHHPFHGLNVEKVGDHEPQPPAFRSPSSIPKSTRSAIAGLMILQALRRPRIKQLHWNPLYIAQIPSNQRQIMHHAGRCQQRIHHRPWPLPGPLPHSLPVAVSMPRIRSAKLNSSPSTHAAKSLRSSPRVRTLRNAELGSLDLRKARTPGSGLGLRVSLTELVSRR